MFAVKKLKRNKNVSRAKDLLSTVEEVKAFRVALEKDTEKAYEAFAQGKRKALALAHGKFFD